MPETTDPTAALTAHSLAEAAGEADRRLTDLEVKASFTEDLVDHLNALVVRQQQQIDLLMREVAKLKDRAPDAGGVGGADARDERPPHY